MLFLNYVLLLFILLVVKHILYFLICGVFFGCVNSSEEKIKEVEMKPQLSVVQQHKPAENVLPAFYQEIENWEELKAVHTFLKRFEKASANEVLSNALELKELVRSLKDSVVPKTFNKPSFIARINVLHNETLRLADLTFIPSVRTTEINQQIDKTIASFSAVNSKINTILSKKKFEDAIAVNLDFIGIDSTKIDSISKKSIGDSYKEKMAKNKLLPKKTIPKNFKEKLH